MTVATMSYLPQVTYLFKYQWASLPDPETLCQKEQWHANEPMGIQENISYQAISSWESVTTGY